MLSKIYGNSSPPGVKNTLPLVCVFAPGPYPRTSLLHSYVGKLALVMGLNGCFKNTLGRVFIFCMAVNGTNVALPPI